MIDAMIQGRLRGAPELRKSAAGREWVKACLSAAESSGDYRLIHLAAFDDAPMRVLLGLADGLTVCVVGQLKADSTYTDKHGEIKPSLSLVVQQALSVHQAARKRGTRGGEKPTAGHSAHSDDFNESTQSWPA